MSIRLEGIQKSYAGVSAVKNISIEVEAGETLALLGPSGSGKTTLLRLIAGLERPDEGQIFFAETLMSSATMIIPAHKRGVNMVFQDLALWPHMTAGQHIDFALVNQGQSKKERQDQIAGLLDLVRLKKATCYPHQLSGGEKQRLALARALASQPQILLMDEPFSSLDQGLKEELLAEVKGIIETDLITTVYVTHNHAEAQYLATRTVALDQGRLA